MDSHLIAVKVGIEGCADQWMQLNGLALDQHGLKGLNAKPVQRWCPVEHDGMLANNLFKNIPDFGDLLLHKLLGCLDGGGHATQLKLVEDERLKEFKGHKLGQPALVKLKRGADHNDRPARVVDPFAQEVLTKASALAFDHVGK